MFAAFSLFYYPFIYAGEWQGGDFPVYFMFLEDVGSGITVLTYVYIRIYMEIITLLFSILLLTPA